MPINRSPLAGFIIQICYCGRVRMLLHRRPGSVRPLPRPSSPLSRLPSGCRGAGRGDWAGSRGQTRPQAGPSPRCRGWRSSGRKCRRRNCTRPRRRGGAERGWRQILRRVNSIPLDASRGIRRVTRWLNWPSSIVPERTCRPFWLGLSRIAGRHDARPNLSEKCNNLSDFGDCILGLNDAS